MKKILFLFTLLSHSVIQLRGQFSFGIGTNFYIKPLVLNPSQRLTKISYDDMVRPFNPNENLEGFGLPLQLSYSLNRSISISYEPVLRYDEINFLQNNKVGTPDEMMSRRKVFTNNSFVFNLNSKNGNLINSLGIGLFNTFQKIRTPIDYYPRSFTGESIEASFLSYGFKFGNRNLKGGIKTNLIGPRQLPISRFLYYTSDVSIVFECGINYKF